MIRMDERQQRMLTEFDEVKKEVRENSKAIRDAKVGFSVVSVLATIGASFIIGWENIKQFFREFK